MSKSDSFSSSGNHETLLLDSLLDDIYNHHTNEFGGHTTTNESDSNTLTNASSSPFDADRSYYTDRQIFNQATLSLKSVEELREIRCRLSVEVNQVSAKLVRLLKQRDITNRKVEKLANILTAVLQATSAKTAADAKLSFSLAASPGESGWQKWVDAMRAISRLPGGIPEHFRRKLWVGLADNYLASNRIDWNAVVRTAFNDKSNPDDSALGLQIVKDLHRTGCSDSFLPANVDAEAERTLLKRVLLAYARWNKQVGYCQGFNVLATVILDTVDRQEADALKVMIYLIDHVLPANYYSNCLRLLAVDLAVFRSLLTANLPLLAQHLDKLQKKATTASDGIFYEPPLTNVFLMQWLLTLYATCLPKHALLRLWDVLLLNGSEALLSAGLHIFSKLSKNIMVCGTVDHYYTSMEKNVKSILRETKPGTVTEADSFIQAIYKQLTPSVGELREQLLYSIQPFNVTSPVPSSATSSFWAGNGNQPAAIDNRKDGPASLLGCFSSFCGPSLQHQQQDGNNKINDAYINDLSDDHLREIGAVRERMTTDLKKLKRNYDRMIKKRSGAIVVVPSAVDSGYDTPTNNSDSMINSSLNFNRSLSLSSPVYNRPCFLAPGSGVINHLLVSKVGLEEVNQKSISVPFLEMIAPPCSSVSGSPNPPPSPAAIRHRFLPTTSTANKYPQDPATHSLLNDTLTLADDQNLSSITMNALTLGSLSSPSQTDRAVLSALPTSPELKQTTHIKGNGELVEIDITSDCEYSCSYTNESQSRCSESESHDKFSDEQAGETVANENGAGSSSSFRHTLSACYYTGARGNYQQVAADSVLTTSHFPISTAARVKQRFRLIPGLATTAAAAK